jgi:hypothetical protein
MHASVMTFVALKVQEAAWNMQIQYMAMMNYKKNVKGGDDGD